MEDVPIHPIVRFFWNWCRRGCPLQKNSGLGISKQKNHKKPTTPRVKVAEDLNFGFRKDSFGVNSPKNSQQKQNKTSNSDSMEINVDPKFRDLISMFMQNNPKLKELVSGKYRFVTFIYVNHLTQPSSVNHNAENQKILQKKKKKSPNFSPKQTSPNGLLRPSTSPGSPVPITPVPIQSQSLRISPEDITSFFVFIYDYKSQCIIQKNEIVVRQTGGKISSTSSLYLDEFDDDELAPFEDMEIEDSIEKKPILKQQLKISNFHKIKKFSFSEQHFVVASSILHAFQKLDNFVEAFFPNESMHYVFLLDEGPAPVFTKQTKTGSFVVDLLQEKCDLHFSKAFSDFSLDIPLKCYLPQDEAEYQYLTMNSTQSIPLEFFVGMENQSHPTTSEEISNKPSDSNGFSLSPLFYQNKVQNCLEIFKAFFYHIQKAQKEVKEQQLIKQKFNQIYVLSGTGSRCVRMRGIPWTTTAVDVVNFFEGCQAEEVLIMKNWNTNLLTGDVYVMFSTHEDAVKSFQKDHQNMKNRYIELFASSEMEMRRAISAQEVARKKIQYHQQAATPPNALQYPPMRPEFMPYPVNVGVNPNYMGPHVSDPGMVGGPIILPPMLHPHGAFYPMYNNYPIPTNFLPPQPFNSFG